MHSMLSIKESNNYESEYFSATDIDQKCVNSLELEFRNKFLFFSRYFQTYFK